jgi:thiamine-monophosphate kinase
VTQNITDIGEFGLIERIKKLVPESEFGVVLGIGDDTAAVDLGDGRLLLLTCDVQIEDRHFCRRWITPRQLGRRAAAINLSDIAAMGGRPTVALLSLALPPDLEVPFFDELTAGVAERLGQFGASLVGGNLSGSDHLLVVDLTLVGEVSTSSILRRDGAREGDALLVTGTSGDSAAGLAVLETGDPLLQQQFSALVERHLDPEPRVAEGRALADSGAVTAMIDISDGLASDLRHLCEASGLGAEIEEALLPRSETLELAATALGRDPLEFLLYGGEAYELLFTVAPERVEAAIKTVRQATGLTVTQIGRMLPEAGQRWLRRASGERVPLPARGWDHFGMGEG